MSKLLIPKAPVLLPEEYNPSPLLGKGNGSRAINFFQECFLMSDYLEEDISKHRSSEISPMNDRALIGLPEEATILRTPQNGAIYLPNGEGRIGDIKDDNLSLFSQPGIRLPENCDVLIIIQRFKENIGKYAASLAISAATEHGSNRIEYGIY